MNAITYSVEIVDHATLLSAIGSAEEIGEYLDEKGVTVRRWKQTNCIPCDPVRWPKLIELASSRGIAVDEKWLTSTTPARKARQGAE